MEKRFSLALGAIAAALVANQVYASNRLVKTEEHLPGQILVKTNNAKVAVHALQAVLGENGILNVRTLRTDATVEVIRIAKEKDLNRAIAALKAEPGVQYAEPNYVLRALDSGIPNDPDLSKTWGIRNTGQADSGGQLGIPGADVNVFPLWQEGFHGNQKVVVAVIDTGIDWNHPDIKANLFTNPGEINGDPAKDNDGNGFVYDIHGWNFHDNNNQSMDDHNHGTHCSGTIGAVGDNAIGISGINWNVSLMPVKFLGADGSGAIDAAVEAINYARIMHANIMSNSWGGGGYSDVMLEAIKKAKDAGILFIAAAGNNSSDNDSNPHYPGSYAVDNVIAVAATDNRDQLATFSNFGLTTVHVAAPGVNVYSTTRNNTYSVLSGTSMATPHVSGVAALVWSANPSYSYADIKDRLIKTSDPVPGLTHKVVANGRIDAYNALHGIIPR